MNPISDTHKNRVGSVVPESPVILLVDNKEVLLIECQSSPSPVFLKIDKNEEFYVRVGPGNRRLSTSEVLAYVTNRKTKY